MPSYTNNVKVTGDPELHASFGTVDIEIDETGEVVVGIPDRFGHSTMYNFAPADWVRVVEMFVRATAASGQVVEFEAKWR